MRTLKATFWSVAAYAALTSPTLAATLSTQFAGDGSVRTIIAIADGSVREIDLGGTVSGDGSVRTLKGANGLLDGGLNLQSLDVSAKPDPFIAYGITATSLIDTPLTYSFLFATPYVGGPYDLLTYLFDIDVKDGRGDGVTIDAVSHVVSVDGVSEIALGPALACAIAAGPPDMLTDCDDGSAQKDLLSDPTGTLQILVTFTVSAHDTIIVTGRADLLNRNEIPEPASLLLLAGALLGLRAAGRRAA